MLAKTFSIMIIVSVICSVFTGKIEFLANEVTSSFGNAVSLCINLLGMMCFWSGVMNVLRDAGAVGILSRIFKPFLGLVYGRKFLDKETSENLSLSMSANFLGLGNASLPLGIRAVKGLQKNMFAATDSAIMFAVLNTVPFQLLPSTLIAMRSGYGCENPFDVVPYIWICCVIINVFAVVVCKVFGILWREK